MGSTTRRTGILTFGTRQVDMSRGQVKGPVPARLTGLETAILVCLSAAGGQTVSRETLLRQAWGYHATQSWRAVDAAVYRLRRKIEEDPDNPHWLLTVRGDGYRLVPPDAPAERLSRAAEVAALSRRLAEGPATWVVVGLPGVGRSWLMRNAVDATAVWVDLTDRGDVDDVLHALAMGLKVSARAASDVAGMLSALGQALQALNGRPLVLDEAERARKVLKEFLPLLRAASPNARILVGIDSPLGLPDERLIRVEPLSPAAARAFFLTMLPPGFSATTAELEGLLDCLGGLPLALELAASCLAWCSMTDLRRQLEQGVAVLDIPALRAGRAGAGVLFRHSFLELPSDRRTLLLELLPYLGPVPLSRVEGFCEAEQRPAKVAALFDLVGRGWVRRHGDHYRLHPVLRSFLLETYGLSSEVRQRYVAAGLAAIREVAPPVGDFGRWATRSALVDVGEELLRLGNWAPPGEGLGRLALAAEAWLEGRALPQARREILDRALGSPELPESLRLDLRIARARLELGWGDWVAATQSLDALLVEIDGDRYPARKAWVLWYRQAGQIAGTGEEQLAAVAEGLPLVARSGDPVLEGMFGLFAASVGWAERRIGSVDAVDAAFQRASAILVGAGELSGAVFAELHRSAVLQAAGRWQESRRSRQRAAELDAASADHIHRGGVLAHRYFDRLLDHDLEGAASALLEALEVDTAEGKTANRPFLLVRLAMIALDRGGLLEAERRAGEALATARGADGRRLVEPSCAYVLAVVALERGEVGAGIQLARSALSLGSPRETQLLEALIGYAAARMGEPLPDPLELLEDDALSPSLVWWLGALCLQGKGERVGAWLKKATPRIGELIPGYGDILVHRLRRAARLPVAEPEPPPPSGAPPADVRSLLLRAAGRWFTARNQL